MSGRTVLTLHNVPKSVNRQSRGSPWPFHNEKRRWQGELFIAMLAEKLPKPLASVHATAWLRFPSQRRRDEGNYRMMLEKALGDALQLQWLPDDTPEHFTFGALRFEEEKGPKRTTIVLDYEPA